MAETQNSPNFSIRRRVDIVGEELRATLGSSANPIQLRTVNGTIRIQTKG
jgi:hypothetical protein